MNNLKHEMESMGFDLAHWERLERLKLLSRFDKRFRLGDHAFDLMDLRDIIAEVNEDG